jgi:hypothetical protein
MQEIICNKCKHKFKYKKFGTKYRYCLGVDSKNKSAWGYYCLQCEPYNEREI